MKRASFTAAVVFCAAALFFWSFPDAFLPTILFTVAAVGIVLVLFLLYRKRWLRDVFFALCCLTVSAVILWFPVSDYYETIDTYDGKTVAATATLTEDPVLTTNGFYRYTARLPRENFSAKIEFYSSVYYTDAGGTVTATFTFSRLPDEWKDSYRAEGIALFAEMSTPVEDTAKETAKSC